MQGIGSLKTLDTSIVSLIILAFVFFSVYRSWRGIVSNKLFIALVLANVFMLVVDILGWVFNALPGQFYLVLNTGFNLLLYITAPAIVNIWVLYLNYQIYKDETRMRKAIKFLAIPFAVNALLSIASLFTGWFFSVDASNVYHRGDLIFIHLAYSYALFIFSFIFLLLKRKSLEKGYFFSLVFFFAPPATGAVIQALNYGVSYTWVGIALSVLLVYLNIQNRGLNTDYLTGAYNRRQLDGYAKSKVRSISGGGAFSAIMLDLDGMKEINDIYGHSAGDEALKDAVTLIKDSLRSSDFVARVGGDEFIVILDIINTDELSQATKRIQLGVDAFNNQHIRPYSISFSYGYDVYKASSGIKLDDFFKHIDCLMYEDKKNKQSRSETV